MISNMPVNAILESQEITQDMETKEFLIRDYERQIKELMSREINSMEENNEVFFKVSSIEIKLHNLKKSLSS